MEIGPLRWALSDGVFLFRVPDEEKIFDLETIILLSSSLNAISIFLDKAQLTFNDNTLSIVRLHFHPPFTESDEMSAESGYVIHSSFKEGFCFQSIFYDNEITNELSEFENAFLESVVYSVLENLEKEGRTIADIPFLQNNVVITEVEYLLHDIDTNYKTLASSWILASSADCNLRFDFHEVCYNGKIQVSDLIYDLPERAIEIFSILDFTKEEKLTLYRIAKGLISLSSLLYRENSNGQIRDDKLNFAHSEIIFQANLTGKMYRLDVRSYAIEGEQFCDITIMSD